MVNIYDIYTRYIISGLHLEWRENICPATESYPYAINSIISFMKWK